VVHEAPVEGFLLALLIAALLGGPLLWTVRATVHRILLDEVSQKGASAAAQIVDLVEKHFQSADEKILLPVLQAAQDQTGRSMFWPPIPPAGSWPIRTWREGENLFGCRHPGRLERP